MSKFKRGQLSKLMTKLSMTKVVCLNDLVGKTYLMTELLMLINLIFFFQCIDDEI